ncbi:hypothetical protein GCK72_012714 [Caenorhabditis remanei]|uniref:CUT domain-containing protein n=1 Tax=Caenorhabditis remanei TaxID=31234 RepID=A0A6A5GNN0_CAERE|nr:hypothetical protein GCK72_012714 [Caenorhabditis remanei]KAF1756261.1 hypothetical protein GCK72_012714 [Caenorhabditis remanei]
MSDSDPPAEPNRNRKRKSDLSSNTPSSSSRPPQPVPVSSGSSTQSSSSITVENVIGTLRTPLGDGNLDEDKIAAKVLTFTEEYGEKKCGDRKLEMKNPNMETIREEESHDASNTPSSSSRPPQPVPISSGSSTQSSSSVTVEDIIKTLRRPVEDGNLDEDKLAEKVLAFTDEYGEKVAASIGRIWVHICTEMKFRDEGAQYKDMKAEEQKIYLRLFNWFKYYEDSQVKEEVLDLHEELEKRWQDVDGRYYKTRGDIRREMEEESYDASNTPSSSSHPPQPALIFYPYWKHGIPMEIQRDNNRQLFDKTLQMQTESTRRIQKIVATLSTSSPTQSFAGGAPRSKPNYVPVQIVNMMKDQEKTFQWKLEDQLHSVINAPISKKSIKIVHNHDIGITHYESVHYISPSLRNFNVVERHQGEDHQLRANKNMAAANTLPVQFKSLFPSDIQGIPPIGPSPPGCHPYPGLYHDQHNPVTDEIWNNYFLYLQDFLPQILAPPTNMASARNYSVSNFLTNYGYSIGSQYSSDGGFSQNVLGGHESGLRPDMRQYLQSQYNYSGGPQSSSAGRCTQNAPGGYGQDRGFGTSDSATVSHRTQRRSNTHQGDTSSAQSEPLNVDDIFEKLNRPLGNEGINTENVIKEVKEFIKNNKAVRITISQSVGKSWDTFRNQIDEKKRRIDTYHELPNPNLKELYLRLFNWLKYYEDDEKRKAVLTFHKELNARWSQFEKTNK